MKLPKEEQELTEPGDAFTYRPSPGSKAAILKYRKIEAKRTGSKPPSNQVAIDTLCKLGLMYAQEKQS